MNETETLQQSSPRVLGVIPARLASERLPGKPLKLIRGKTLIERVYRRAEAAKKLSRFVVAADSREIERTVVSFRGEVVLTARELSTGSERVRAAWLLLGGRSAWDVIVNIQGDMPFIPPSIIDEAVEWMIVHREDYDMVTVATPIRSEEVFLRSSVVKVVIGEGNRGLYFSRAPIPWSRDGDHQRDPFSLTGGSVFGFKHLGLYVFSPSALDVYDTPEATPLERVEKLEQLRLLERGFRVGVLPIEQERLATCIEIDTPDDLLRADALIGTDPSALEGF